MADNSNERLFERLAVKEWLAPEPVRTSVFAWHFVPWRLAGRFSAVRLRAMEVPPQRTGWLDAIAPPSALRMTDSIWQAGEEHRDTLLHLTTYEMPSREAGRAQLLRTLADFQRPALERNRDVGDVAFAVVGDAAGVLVRGNLVVLVRNGGPKIVGVGPALKSVDDELVREPERAGKRIDLGIGRARPELKKPLRLALEPPRTGSWYRILGEGGDIRLEKGRVAFVPTAAGRLTLTVELKSGGLNKAFGTATLEI